MRAIVFEQFGEPADVLQVRNVPVPEPGRGEVRVRMLASPVNPSDLLEIRGQYSARPTLPATPGHEGVGIVEAAGGGMLPRLLVGKRVAVLNRKTGNWCEQTIIPARQAIPLPKDLPIEQAAMFFINPATAYVMTRRELKIPPGRRGRHWDGWSSGWDGIAASAQSTSSAGPNRRTSCVDLARMPLSRSTLRRSQPTSLSTPSARRRATPT
jgi:NADPH:quinone reductase-like Zn-dependent oxidoreductase